MKKQLDLLLRLLGAATLLLLLLWLGSAAFSQEKAATPYRLDWNKGASWGLCIAGGIAWGTHEALYADPHVLEKRFGFDPYHWGGSEDWQRKYPGGRYQEGESPVWLKDKTNVLREAKKTTAFVGRYFPVTAGIVITLGKHRNWKDYAIAAVLYSGSATLTYNYLR